MFIFVKQKKPREIRAFLTFIAYCRRGLTAFVEKISYGVTKRMFWALRRKAESEALLFVANWAYTTKMQTSEFTPSDSNLNDILLTQYDIRLSPHDILAFGKHDIISVPLYAKHISSTAGGYHTEGISPVRAKERISLKNDKFLSKLVVFHGADDGNRTRVSGLGSERSAIELHLHFFASLL